MEDILYLHILTRLSHPPDTIFLTYCGLPVWSNRAFGVSAGAQLTALQPICREKTQLNLKVPSKVCSRQHSKKKKKKKNFEKISLEISCESSAPQTIHMKCQDLFSKKKIKNKRNIFKSVVCCSCDWRLKVKSQAHNSLNLLMTLSCIFPSSLQNRNWHYLNGLLFTGTSNGFTGASNGNCEAVT